MVSKTGVLWKLRRSVESIKSHDLSPFPKDVTRDHIWRNVSLFTITTVTSTKLFDKYAVYLLQSVSKCGLQLQYYDVRTKFGRSNSSAKNNDLNRFTKFSIFTADLFYNLYLPIRSSNLAKYRNNLVELLTNTEETSYFTQRTTARGSKHMYTVFNHNIFLFP